MNPSDAITVLIADDHPLFLKGLRSVLDREASLRVIAEVNDGIAAWKELQALSPDVAILDVDMPGLDGMQIARRVMRHKLPVRLVMLTLHKTEALFRQAVDLGVLGYLLKDDTAVDVVDCVRAVAVGRHFIAPALSSFLVRPSAGRATAVGAHVANLSSTQREVLKLIALGHTSKEIGAELGISFRTVENHRFRIVEKLGLKGSNSLLRFAIEHKSEL